MRDVRSALIRDAGPSDWASVQRLLVAAFQSEDEARLVRLLRKDRSFICELVAVIEQGIAGELMLSRLSVSVDQREPRTAALAPLAVRPDLQRLGIGSRLVSAGLDRLKEEGFEAVIVLGDPVYYARFGFSSSCVAHLITPYPGESFMGLELAPAALKGVEGIVAYSRPFQVLENEGESSW